MDGRAMQGRVSLPGAGTGTGVKSKKVRKFIYDLPHREYKDIEDMLNMNDTWETLAGDHLQISVGEVDKMRMFNMKPGTSAAKSLLDYLSNRNTTISDLFLLLHKVEMYRGMDILRQYVPDKLHHLIKTGPVISRACDARNQPGLYAEAPGPVPEKKMPGYDCEEETCSQNILTASQQGSQQDTTARLASTATDKSFQSVREIERLRHLSDLDPRVRHNSETTSGSSTASSITSGVPLVSYDELARACNNWNPANKLGEGGFGQVFKGVWKHQEVAIKTIKKDKYLVHENLEHRNKSIMQCFKEINFLNQIRSEYIVPIIAQSEANFNGSLEPCIVYQWMPNGSLDDRLQKKQGTPALSWAQRYTIAMGTANGIQFLHNHDHSGKQLVHGDIKSANILLDKNFEPKIGDFGLAREVDGGKSKYFVLSTIYGTQFYLPQDFLRSKKLSAKVDTYSFGVILFDLVTGKRPQTKVVVDGGREHLLDVMRESQSIPSQHVDVSWLEHPRDSHLCKILYNVGKQCTADRAKNRPEMEDVYQSLKRAMRTVSTSPSPYEIQQRFDSLNKEPEVGRVSDDLIDLSTPTNRSEEVASVLIPATISRHHSEALLPAVISSAVPSSSSINMSDIPLVVNTEMSSSSTMSLPSDYRDTDNLDSLERDIDQSAQMLSALGF